MLVLNITHLNRVGFVSTVNWYTILTLKCIRGGVHLDPCFRFLRLLLKRVKIFLRSFLVIA